MPTEIELKLRLPPASVPRLQRSSLLKSLSSSPPVTRKIYSIYYDTSDFDLKKHYVALRLRRDGRRWIQTVKGEGNAAAGLYQHNEWETPILSAQPDLTKISGTSLAKIFQPDILREQLHPVFETEFNRTIRRLRLAGGQEVEFCLDRGKITAKSASISFCEIELELKSGPTLSLFQLALDLLHSFPSSMAFRLESSSKAERGYALASGSPSPPYKAMPVGITAEMPVNEAFKAIAWNCLNHMHSNEAGMLAAADIEYLHQMRVALRRERSAVSIFSQAFGKPPFVEVAGDLRSVANRLGPARDWDVFLSETVDRVCAAFPKHHGMMVLKEKFDQIRESHNNVARNAVDSTAYTELMLQLGAWLYAEPWLPRSDTPIPPGTTVAHFATSVLTRRHRQLRKCGRNIEALESSQLHALRILAKKQRYAIEFFAALYPRKETKRYLKSLCVLQDVLGGINDVTGIDRYLAETNINSDCCDEYEAAGLIRGWCASVAASKQTELSETWRVFAKSKPFW